MKDFALVVACYAGLAFFAGLRLASWRIRKIAREELTAYHLWRMNDASGEGRVRFVEEFNQWRQRSGMGG